MRVASLGLRFTFVLAALALAALFMAAGVACLCGAIDLALMQAVSPASAAMGAAGAAFVIAAAIGVIGFVVARRSRKEAAFVDGNRMAVDLGALLGREAMFFAAAQPRGAALGALLTGFAAGADPALRRVLRDVLH